MTVEECYAAMGGDYAGMLSRFRTEERIVKFLGKFLDDKTFAALEQALADGNQEEAFRAAHTLKGVAQNLSLTKLYESSHDLTELLRAGDMAEAAALMGTVSEDYQQTVEAVEALIG